jgi:hypothetical protein
VDYGARQRVMPHSSQGKEMAYPEERPVIVSEVPEGWQRYAREPWRIIVPDLDWKPPEVE